MGLWHRRFVMKDVKAICTMFFGASASPGRQSGSLRPSPFKETDVQTKSKAKIYKAQKKNRPKMPPWGPPCSRRLGSWRPLSPTRGPSADPGRAPPRPSERCSDLVWGPASTEHLDAIGLPSDVSCGLAL